MMDTLKQLFGIGAKQDRLVVASGFQEPMEKTLFSSLFGSSPAASSGNCIRITPRTPLLSPEDVGGKAHNVIKLFRTGVSVPESCVITCAEYERGSKTQTVSDDVKNALGFFLDPNSKYAVRSSASCEDGADSAYAGRFTTELNVPGTVDAICAAVIKCWSSMEVPDLKEKLEKLNARMGVVIMRQIDSKKAGVLFQANPITGSKATHVITAAYGQGEGVVGGTLSVDTYSLKEDTLEIRNKQISKKERMLVLDDAERTKETAVPADLQNVQCLTDEEILQVAKTGKKIRQHCSSPQDIEFAFDAAGKLYILQTRPITALAASLTWTPPDVGLWQLNGHLAMPMSKFYAPMWRAGHSRGGFQCTVYTGAGVAAMDTTEINGFAYFCMRNPGPKAAPKSLPPAFILRNIIRLTGRKSIRDARAFWNQKLWRKFLEQEYPKLKQEWHGSIQEWIAKLENVSQVTDAELADLLGEAQKWGGYMYGEHAAVTMYNLSPIGWFVMRAMQLTGCDAVEGFSCIDGFSDISQGLAGEFPQEMKLVSEDEEISRILGDSACLSDTASALETLKLLDSRKDESEGFTALNRVVQTIKYRLAEGYDSANSTMVECPTLIFQAVVDAIRKVKENSIEKARGRGMAAAEALMARVESPKAKKELEELLVESRFMAGLRDERAILTDLTAMGIIHHLLLECGERLVKRSDPTSESRPDAALVLFATLEDMQEYLRDKNLAPSVTFWMELESRKKYRQEASIMDAPPTLNGQVLKPSFEHFPDPLMARSVHTIIFAIDQIFAAPDMESGSTDASKSVQNDKSVIIGYPGAKGARTGRARVVSTAQDAADLQQGEICVTQYPSSIINMILGKAGGIVTDLGGILCHAAICAREAELPCVVGCHTATSRIKTGDMLEIDGTTGIVKIIGR